LWNQTHRMKRFFPVALLLLICSITAFAQTPYTVKGEVIDTVSKSKLVNTSVSVLRSKDSTLVKFTRVLEDGTFSISGLPKEKMFLLVSYPGYADYVEQFLPDSSASTHNFGQIKMILKATLLAAVIIKGKAMAVRLKGDTTEFDAAAYDIQPNSKVEDLLKQLPGIEVDKDGKITAQGKTVTKVLVDGEEFFGDDPTLVTKNIRGDMVDKVQLYDKKSDQAAFTGIDDGKKDKTINITLKENKKNGYFGKADLRGGNKGFYDTQGMFNMFRGKQKFAAYGTFANTGRTGLGWQDNSNFGSLDNMEVSDDGSVTIFTGVADDGLDSFNGNYDGQGIPVARTGGLHYDGKWNLDKQSLNTNYKLGSLQVEGSRNTISQNNLPSGIIVTNTDENFHNYMFRQKLDGTYQIKLDSTSNLKLSVDGTKKHSEKNSAFMTNARRGDLMINQTERSLDNDVDDKIFNAKLLWTKKFKKERRTLSVNLTGSVNESEGRGFLKSTNRFFYENLPDSVQVVDQLKTNRRKSTVLNANIAYTEPLSKKLALVLNYGLNSNNNSTDRKSFNQSPDGKYGSLDTLYSNHYQLDQLSNQGGAILNFNGAKTKITLGTMVANVDFKQKNLYNNNVFERHFINWNPQARYIYQFSQQQSINIDYNGNTSQPSIDQIQPLRVNTDPLNITLGNPELKPSFTNRFSLGYSSYKIISSKSLYLWGSYSFTSNPIVNNLTTDSSGKSTFQSLNLRGESTSNYNLFLYYSRKIDAIDINVGTETSLNGNTSYNYINGALNKGTSRSISANLTLDKSMKDKMDIRLNGGPTYTTNESSLQQQVNDNGWGLRAGGYLTVFLPAKFELKTDASYEYRAKTQSFDSDFRRTIWNASITKKFLKSEGLRVGLNVNDLLNQNKGFDRSASGNFIIQNNYTTIQRYFTATVTWDFNKMGGSAKK